MTAQEKAAADKAAADKAAADKAAADNATAEKDTGTKVKFVKSHQAYGYHVGETGQLPADKATKLVADGYCQAVVPQTDEQR